MSEFLLKKPMNISELWIEHSQAIFPKGYGGKDVNGVCVTSIDTYATGCVSSYIGNEKRDIDIERYQVLQKCKNGLGEILPYIEGEAFTYFNRLHEMCCIIIAEANIT